MGLRYRRLPCVLMLLACGAAGADEPTRADVAEFIARAEAQLTSADEAHQRAQWVAQTHLTDDTNWLAARSSESFTGLQMKLAHEASGFDRDQLDPVARRQLALLALLVRSPAPADAGVARHWADLQARLVTNYNRHSVRDGARTLGSYGEVRRAMEMTSDPVELARLWREWHRVGSGLQSDYADFVELSRAGANALGFADVGELWRSVYDMPPDQLDADSERLWRQVEPLYHDLHCFVRGRLSSAYGARVQPATGPIRIELTRNPMGMYWIGAYDQIAADLPTPDYDLDAILAARRLSGRAMTEYADRFWSSMGFPPMPESFWNRSMFEKPPDRNVVCPGSAAIIDGREDVRIKICAGANALDFTTLHHEVGHAVYARAYHAQPYLFRNSANDAFHEAFADLGALSITPRYLQDIGLIDAGTASGSDQDLGLLLRMALQRVSFMPFSLIVDKWRWQVFDGTITPARYDASWWELVGRYQGLSAGEARPEGSFDVASLPHITSNVSYIRYFYAYLIEFQLFKAACDRAGWTGPLHRCSLYDDKANGARLQRMLALGASRPWQDALEIGTGQRSVSADGMLAYFRPLSEFLQRENRGRKCGW